MKHVVGTSEEWAIIGSDNDLSFILTQAIT